MKSLQTLAAHEDDNWWTDLLSLWCPSGSPAHDTGLRLAVRDGSLNFYHLGQSIARITFDKKGSPQLRVHSKYVWPDLDSSQYVKLLGAAVPGRPAIEYRGVSTLIQWMSAARKYGDKEKEFVDGLIHQNVGAIDVEMGLPGEARRIDLVSLEEDQNAVCAVFWEAKLIGNGELRCRDASKGGGPKVCGQLNRYRAFLGNAARNAEVQQAVVNTCGLLKSFHDMARLRRTIPDLAAEIFLALERPDSVVADRRAHLVILDDGTYSATEWPKHETVLRDRGEPLVMLKCPERITRAMAVS